MYHSRNGKSFICQGASLSEQQAALQEHLQQLTETEYVFIMNKFSVSSYLNISSLFNQIVFAGQALKTAIVLLMQEQFVVVACCTISSININNYRN